MAEPLTLHPSGDEADARAALARRLAAMAHPARIEILRHLAQNDGRCCKEVVTVLDLAQSTVSQHLKVLVEAGLVEFAPAGKRSRYCLNRAALAELRQELDVLLAACCTSGCTQGQPRHVEN
jgi:ArsR family transcriptional regulator, arsenate/arsenite/antimonite-responsive transcriptional repressor